MEKLCQNPSFVKCSKYKNKREGKIYANRLIKESQVQAHK